jgi:hypothetical protein
MTLLDHVAYITLLFVVFGGVTLVGFAVFKVEQAKNMFRAGDKLFATFFDFNGYATLSAECGRLKVLHDINWPAAIIDFLFGKNHCVDAAFKEKLLPEPR